MIKDNAPAAVDEFSRSPEGLRTSFATPGECTASLAQVRAPTLIVANPDERVAKATDVLRGAIPGARTVTFDTRSMLLNLEREADFNETLRGFLGQHRPPPL
jgi:pimeloyl-ACP methyl ester carboxylesterase